MAKQTLSVLWLFTVILAGCRPAEIKTYGEIPAFSLPMATVKTDGFLTREDLRGKVWVANFIFTHCNGPCPMLSRRMKELQDKLPDGIGFLTFTIDPARDSLGELRKYALRFGADPHRWFFVTGEKADLYRLFEEGFKVVAEEDKARPLAERFVHTTMLVLIDARGQIRGYYNGEHNDALFRLKRDSLRLKT